MKPINIVVAILLLLFGIKFASSPLFNSLLSFRFESFDYRILPGLGALILATIVVVAKILANSLAQNGRGRNTENEPQDEEIKNHWDRGPQRPEKSGSSMPPKR
jgi:hypothetical protein